ncbi:hypothetical protein [Gordonia polyisoprenivorans]|uniref:hypothetical protein n=1 Tax=Gordonia polyisoprenivorans TaxID=84595 RepID=UPI002300C6E2|nr:hypothetical protein [Gordonia polyisoprenivorans]WCB38211.1 hypothetical protein PHA63_03395 [Gordonia polyisoprenivorans]
MSEFIKKIKDEAKAVEAAIDNELTVLEGVPGYDPLAKDEAEDEDEADATATASDDTEGGGSPVDEPK